MDTKAFFGRIHRFECGACLIELFGWEKTVLRCETPWRLLRPSICAQRHKNDGEDSQRFNKRIDHVYLQSKRGEPLAFTRHTGPSCYKKSPHSTRKPARDK